VEAVLLRIRAVEAAPQQGRPQLLEADLERRPAGRAAVDDLLRRVERLGEREHVVEQQLDAADPSGGTHERAC
jgi:hypothetical protein